MPKTRSAGAALAIPAWAWLLLFFVAPVLLVVYFSFGYKPGIFGTHATDILSFDRYIEAMSPTFFTTFQNTLWVGIGGTVLCFLVGAPVAYWMAFKVRPERRGLLIALVLVPFWTNFLVRTIGWQIILSPEGAVSQFLSPVLGGPIELLYTREAVLLGVVYNYLPLMILPLFVAFDRVGPALREASKDLGAGKITTFFRVTLPLSQPGIIAGVLLVFIPLMGDYITATVLGGAKGNMVGQLVAAQFQTAQNWALGSAMAVVLMLIITLTIAVCGFIIYLIALPFRMRNRLVLGPADAAETDAAAAAAKTPSEVSS
ncbi:ABC transporter permease [Microbacterium thalassium]|uniref:Spermidine/putrescine transport system permease protein n=1 Tax=Microbacterium thalassium TaxID=362649 RepID=A0A7X0KUA4_9MICO|nr:ABC transporter permease [Microbacterium thalassium]MBB6390947.1 spermidine/putrescine transport system permease protein [Microbacterium thalassium]GLK26056.1 ABC transporter permease [Microbacterium thalassium]